MAFRLRRGETVSDGLRRIAREQATKAAEIGIEKVGANEELIHEGRTRCKKLRGLLRLVRPEIGEVYQHENSILREAARRLSEARDAAVLVTTFNEVTRDSPAESERIESIRDQLTGTARQLDGTDCEVRLGVFRQTMASFSERVVAWPIEGEDFDAIEAGFVSVYRRGRDAMRKARKSQDDELWHDWRKRAKDHWYHVRIVRNVWKPVMSAREGELDLLSDLLGKDHDFAVLKSALGQFKMVEKEFLQVLTERIEKRQQSIRVKSARLGERLYAETPKAFRKRVKRYWRAWREPLSNPVE